MPVSMSNGAFNLGRDFQMVLTGPGGTFTFSNMTMFESKQDTRTEKAEFLDGRNVQAEIPVGWSGSFSVERNGPGIDLIFAATEQAWVSAGILSPWVICTYIVEPDKSTSAFEYQNVTMKLDDAGNFRVNGGVEQKVSFMSSQKVPI